MEIKTLFAVIQELKMQGSGESQSLGAFASFACAENYNGNLFYEKNDLDFFDTKTFYISKICTEDNPEGYIPNDVVVVSVKDLIKDGTRRTVHHYWVERASYSTVFEVGDTALSKNYCHLNLLEEDLKKYKSLMRGLFYVSIADRCYGPFDLINDRIKPKVGKEVNIYEFDVDRSASFPGQPNISLIFHNLNNPIGIVDCSTDEQILEWIKKLLDQHKDANHLREVINKIKSNLVTLDQTNINKIRYDRALQIIDKLELSFSDLSRFKKDDILGNYFYRSIEKFREEYLKEIQEQTVAHKAELEASINKVEDLHAEEVRKLERLKEQSADQNQKLKNLRDEIGYLDSHRQEIIRDLRLHCELTQIPPPLPTPTVRPVRKYYEMIQYDSNVDEFFQSASDLEDEIYESKVPSNAGDSIIRALRQLEEHRFLRSDDAESALKIFKTAGSSKVYLQNAEADWMKFEKLYDNGLADCVESAISNPQLPHCFVVQDFNLASPECYAKPLFDIQKGTRRCVPGSSVLWPRNLWIIFVAFDCKTEDFGFDINDDSFNGWPLLPLQSARANILLSKQVRLAV